MKQLPLFPKNDYMPDPFEMLRQGASLVISVSGGKDSQAMTEYLIKLRDVGIVKGQIFLVHSDLGRAEHPETEQWVKDYARKVNLPLEIVEHTNYDLLEGIRQRMLKRADAPPWPSAKNRYCTSDWKRNVISRWVRNKFPDGKVIVAMGLRADESPARAKKPTLSVREDCTAITKGRYVYDWLPIHDWTEQDVWAEIGSKENAHPAYLRGNHRLSCLLCVLADKNDLTLGALHDPALYVEYCRIEMQSGFSFRQNLWLGTLNPTALPEDLLMWYRLKGVLP